MLLLYDGNAAGGYLPSCASVDHGPGRGGCGIFGWVSLSLFPLPL